MGSPNSYRDDAIVRMADGTIKQKNLLSGTEVWTVPGRGDRPLPRVLPEGVPLDYGAEGAWCSFCEKRYFDTPPEKERVVREGKEWLHLRALPAKELFSTVADFRRIPNLFEIVSYRYWLLNHGHTPNEEQGRRMAEYLASDIGYDHVMSVVKARILASGTSEERFHQMSESEKLQYANGFFSGGHDVIVAKRHFVEGATQTDQLASSGTLTPEEHFQYLRLTVGSIKDLYSLDPAVKYVVAFQNWLRPAGASFDHLHKQVVAIDERPVQINAEVEKIHRNPGIYSDILFVGAHRRLLIAQNEHAVALAGFGHRYPTVAVWPLGPPIDPWEATPEQLRGISDILHAAHAATGVEVPSNEEWYYRPPATNVPVRWRMLLKWRISTIAGFEGGTRIYLNTLDPWRVRDRAVSNLVRLREEGLVADMRIGDECKVDVSMLS